MRPSTPADLDRYVDRSAGGCWNWTGATGRGGYGYVQYRGRTHRAHRLYWTLHAGPIAPGLWVLHRCDNRLCVNPAHLFLGTHADNMADMVAKGRATGCPQRGEDSSSSKLTEAQVLDIRAKRDAGWTYPGLRKFFGVAHNTLWCIVNRKTWSHI